MIEIKEEDFNEKVLEKSKQMLILVDFSAEWCAPCKMMKPVLDKLAIDFKDKISFGVVNVDENRNLSSQYNIVSIPCIKLFKDVLTRLINHQI